MDISRSQLSISHLKMICQLEKHETVKEAAQALFITQPALTNRIREAERRLNTQLFYRRGRRIFMTNAGQRLLVSAKKILKELAIAEHDISRLTDGVEQVLRVSVPHYASFSWLPGVLKGFNQTLPNIEVEITSQSSIRPLAALAEHEVDMAILSTGKPQFDVDRQQFTTVAIVEDELVACVSKHHKDANKAFLVAEDFADQTYVTNSTVPEKDREFELFFQPAAILPKKVLQVGFNDAILTLVKENLGLSIFSKRQLSSFLSQSKADDVVQIPLGKQGLKVYWHLVYSNHINIEQPANLFANLLTSQLTS